MENIRSLDDLYENFARDLSRYLFFLSRDHDVVQDCVQETFYRAYLHIEELHDDNVKPWLFKVARHLLIDRKRKESRMVTKEATYFHQRTDDRSVLDEVLLQERFQRTMMHIEQLPELQKQAIVLVGLHEFSPKEAASILDISPGHLRILLFRARKALKEKESEIDL